MANIHVSWLDPQKVRKMIVVGSKKMVVYDDVADDKIAIYDKGIDRRAVLGENMDFDHPRAAGIQLSQRRHFAAADKIHRTTCAWRRNISLTASGIRPRR